MNTTIIVEYAALDYKECSSKSWAMQQTKIKIAVIILRPNAAKLI